MVGKEHIGETRVQAVLQEVHFLRQEILENISRVFALHVGSLGAYAGLLSYALATGETLALLLGPLVAWTYTMLWLKYKRHLDVSSWYLRELERDKWPELIGYRDTGPAHKGRYAYKNYWVSWQHYHDRRECMPSVIVGGMVVAATWAFGSGLLALAFTLPQGKVLPEARTYLAIFDGLLLLWSAVALTHHVLFQKESDLRRRIG